MSVELFRKKNLNPDLNTRGKSDLELSFGHDL